MAGGSAAAVWVEVARDAIHHSDWPSLPVDLGTQIGSLEVRARFRMARGVALQGNNDVGGSAHSR